jgi:hypothetical protein
MAGQTSMALSTASMIVGVRIPTPFRHFSGRTGVGTWNLDGIVSGKWGIGGGILGRIELARSFCFLESY